MEERRKKETGRERDRKIKEGREGSDFPSKYTSCPS